MIKKQSLGHKWQAIIGCLLFLVACTNAEMTTIAPITPDPTLTPTSIVLPTTTPTPTLTPGVTASVVQLTATPVHTASPTASITPLPTPTWTPNPPGVLTELPSGTHDLFVIVDGSLKVWRQATGDVETVLAAQPSGSVDSEQSQGENITRFQIDAEGRSIVAARQTNDNPPTHTLIWLDLESGEHLDLAVAIPYLLDFEISPDGRKVAYTIGDPESLGDIGNRQTSPFKGTIYVQDIMLTQPLQSIGVCTNVTLEGEEKGWPGCLALLWTPDSQRVIWADARGIWEYWTTSIAETASLLQPNFYHLEGGFEVNVFQPIDWSPSGRYLRLDVWHWEGGSETILDLHSGQLIEIPYTFAYEGPVISSVSWMQDDRLFMVRTEGAYSNFVNYAEFWRILPEQSELNLEQSINIPTGPEAYVSEAAQLADGSFVFAVFSFEEGDDSAGLYRLDSPKGIPQKTNQLPPQINYYGTVYWTKDGEGSLVILDGGESPDFIYMKPDDVLFYHVRPLFGHYVARDNTGQVQIMWND